VQVVSKITDDKGEYTQTVLRGDTLSYRKLGHTPGGLNETMIEHCSFCTAGEPFQNCVKLNCQNVSNARAKEKMLQLAKRREQHQKRFFSNCTGTEFYFVHKLIIISD
jgi:hypothetical protein